MQARSFFYVCAGLFLLAVGYYLGVRSTVATSRIVTKDLVITDELGRQRVEIEAGLGGPNLHFSDEEGYPTVYLAGSNLTSKGEQFKMGGHGPFGGYLTFYDSSHLRRVQVGFRLDDQDPDGWPVPMPRDQAGIGLYGDDNTTKIWRATGKE